MGTDDSPAGRKFQRWLYHDVVPSLTKHGVYPPPLTPQGSALSQMAEIIAQNSRALADSIVRQDKLEQEVKSVKGDVSNVQERIEKLENTKDLEGLIEGYRRLNLINPHRVLYESERGSVEDLNSLLGQDKPVYHVNNCAGHQA